MDRGAKAYNFLEIPKLATAYEAIYVRYVRSLRCCCDDLVISASSLKVDSRSLFLSGGSKIMQKQIIDSLMIKVQEKRQKMLNNRNITPK